MAADAEQRAVLQVLVDSTSVAARDSALPPVSLVVAADPVFRRIQSAAPEVVLVDIPQDDPAHGAARH